MSLSLFRYRKYYYTMRRRNPRVSRIGDYAFLENRTSDEDDDDECIISLARVRVVCCECAARSCKQRRYLGF